MRKIDEAIKLNNDKDIDDEINARVNMLSVMTSDMIPYVIQVEIEKLQDLKKDNKKNVNDKKNNK